VEIVAGDGEGAREALEHRPELGMLVKRAVDARLVHDGDGGAALLELRRELSAQRASSVASMRGDEASAGRIAMRSCSSCLMSSPGSTCMWRIWTPAGEQPTRMKGRQDQRGHDEPCNRMHGGVEGSRFSWRTTSQDRDPQGC